MLSAATLASATVTAIHASRSRLLRSGTARSGPIRGPARRRLLDLEPRVRDVAHPPVAILLKAALQQRHARPACLLRQRAPVGFGLQDRAEISTTVSPANAGLPASISYSTHPKPRCRSGIRCRPLACSGDMYAAVPRIIPRMRGTRHRGRLRRLASDASVPNAFARPKSSTFTAPVGRDLDVRGLQIAMDDALARAPLRAPRRSVARSAAPRRRHRARARGMDSVSPSTSSTRADVASSAEPSTAFLDSVDRRDLRMVECGQDLALPGVIARRRSDRVRPPSGRTLIATSRLSFVSRDR